VDELAATKRGLLERAMKLLGKTELPKRLNIPTALFDDWVRGDATMPDDDLGKSDGSLPGNRLPKRQPLVDFPLSEI
jgi:hypothetical protein